MPLYTATFFNLDGTVRHRRELYAGDDDGAIDAVGWSSHPHAIDIHDGERRIASYPPLSPQGRYR